jgi:hypothetical protein
MDYIKKKPEKIRFNDDSESDEEIIEYFKNRFTQTLPITKLKWDGKMIKLDEWGILININHENEVYSSIYVRNSFRGKKLFPKYIKENPNKKYVTVKDCEMENFFKKMNVEYILFQKLEWEEYKAIEKYYGDHIAERSKVHFINHIEEGLYILNRINATIEAKKAKKKQRLNFYFI